MSTITMDQKKVNAFWSNRAKIQDPRIATHFKKDDTHIFDLALISEHVTLASDVLDLGCGTCFLSNELLDDVHTVKAVDKYSEFLKHCRKDPRLLTETSDILTYKDNKEYDVILLFGVVMYFGEDDTRKIYEMCNRLLKKGGKIIVKHQCGTKENVHIDTYSDAIRDNYYAVYKHVEKDAKLIKEQFGNVDIIDIYPKRLNTWPNTHFYAFIARKN